MNIYFNYWSFGLAIIIFFWSAKTYIHVCGLLQRLCHAYVMTHDKKKTDELSSYGPWIQPVDTFNTHLDIAPWCRLLSFYRGQGSRCPMVQVVDSYTSASTPQSQARMLRCTRSCGSMDTSGHVHLNIQGVALWKNSHNYLQTPPKCKSWGCFGKFRIPDGHWDFKNWRRNYWENEA